MCGRFSFSINLDELKEAFPWLAWPERIAPRYNIAPGQRIAVVANNGRNTVEFFQWGLIPSWAKDPKIGYRMINARSETLAQKPAFRSAFRRRCLILTTGFFEWRKDSGGGKTPMLIRLKSRKPFAFAGMWETWRASDATEPLPTCTIITTQPNPMIGKFHHRMPVILPPDVYEIWLDPSEKEPSELNRLLVPYPASEMEAYLVSKMVNNPSNDLPECLEPRTLF